MPERRRDGAGGRLTELVATDAADVLHLLEPVDLREFRRNLALAAKLVRAGDLEHRVPVDRRVVLRRLGFVGRRYCVQVENPAGRASYFRRVHEPITPHPHAVIGFRKAGQQVTSAIIGDDDLRVLRRQIGCFGDHPDACLGPVRARDYAAPVGFAATASLRGHLGRAGSQDRQESSRGRCPTKALVYGVHASASSRTMIGADMMSYSDRKTKSYCSACLTCFTSAPTI